MSDMKITPPKLIRADNCICSSKVGEERKKREEEIKEIEKLRQEMMEKADVNIPSPSANTKVKVTEGLFL